METSIIVHGALQPENATARPKNGPRLVYVPANFSTTSPKDRSRAPCTIEFLFNRIKQSIKKKIAQTRTLCATQETTDTNLQGIKEASVILSCNRSIAQHFAAIFQIIFSAKELYDAQGTQVERYGYAAYSFTVTPYLLMSFLNFLAMICEPQYPTLYLVELDKNGKPPTTTEPDGLENIRTHDSQKGVAEAGDTKAISHLGSPGKKPEGQSTDQQKVATGAIGTIFLPGQHQSMHPVLPIPWKLIVGYSVSPH